MKLHLTRQEAVLINGMVASVRDLSFRMSNMLRHSTRGARIDVTALRDLCRQISRDNGQMIVLLGQIERSADGGTDLTAHL